MSRREPQDEADLHDGWSSIRPRSEPPSPAPYQERAPRVSADVAADDERPRDVVDPPQA